ncbi:MAG: mannonate dehydratase [Pseudomonadota bacterium]
MLKRHDKRREAPFEVMTTEQRKQLASNIVSGLPGANDKWAVHDVQMLLATYDQIDVEKLRGNLVDFLELVTPLAAEMCINLCCHPDDPPFSVLGLPRILSTVEDYEKIMLAVDIAQNGITLCTGSMGVLPNVDFVKFIKGWGHRIHFVHLRNTQREASSETSMFSFVESEHLDGDTDMVAVVDGLLAEEKRRKTEGRKDWEIPMRSDHGQEILDDIGRSSLPGYPLIGRLRGLAELRGIMAALDSKHRIDWLVKWVDRFNSIRLFTKIFAAVIRSRYSSSYVTENPSVRETGPNGQLTTGEFCRLSIRLS